MADADACRVLLIGMMGSGKSTIGRLLAERLGWPCVDTDDLVEAATGRSIRHIIQESGEAAFRAEERRAVETVTAGDSPAIVSVAGGAVLDPANRDRIRSSGLVVWLRADLATLAERVGSGEGRPLLGNDPPAVLDRLYRERRPLYEGLANAVVDVDHLDPDDVADIIAARLADAGA